MTHYSRPITNPITRKEGFQNFLQMIINYIESNEPDEALMLAVDLLDTVSGKSNPFASVTDGNTNDVITAQVAAAIQACDQRVAEARREYFAKGVAHARAEMRNYLKPVIGD